MSQPCVSIDVAIVPDMIVFAGTFATCVIWVLYLKYWSFTREEKDLSVQGKQLTNGHSKESSTIKLLGGIALTLQMIALLSWFIEVVMYYTGNCKIGYKLGYNGGWAVYFLAFIVLLGLFGFRLIKTFDNDSKFALSKCERIMAKFGFVVPLTLYIVITALTDYADVIKSSGYEIAVAALVYTICVVVLSILLLRLFIKQLTLVINDFLKQFGNIAPPMLDKLNKSIM